MYYNLKNINKIRPEAKNDMIWLDFGHGGNEPGCTFNDGTKEKDYNLKFGLAVLGIIKKYYKNTKSTRTIDKTVTLHQRSEMMSEVAKSKEIYVYSIHCNAYNKVSRGAEICQSIFDKNYTWSNQFLRDYCNEFALPNRGIIQRKSKSYPSKDYYHLIRETPSNCHVKIIELFFGDNRDDCKKGQSQAFKNKAAFFVASYILKRHGVSISEPVQKPVIDIKDKNGMYYVQVGAFKDKKNALNLAEKIKKSGFDVYIK